VIGTRKPGPDNRKPRGRSRTALGCRVPGRDGLKIACQFDDDTFAQIQSIASNRRVSFSSVVRELVEFGLMDLESANGKQ
jgi:hypothetical protein